VDSLRVTEMMWRGPEEGLPVEAGSRVPFVVGWEISGAATCPGCLRNLMVGFEGGPASCVELAGTATCPELSSGHSTGYLTAPEEPGKYSLMVQVLSTPAPCDNADPVFDAAAQVLNAVPAAVVEVVAPCVPTTCADAGRQCGPFDTGCGQPVACGVCGPGLTCSEAGACQVAEACELDLFHIEEVYINGFKNSAEAELGASVPLLFSWSLGSAAELAEESRQLVVGLDDAAQLCIEVGGTEACPSLSYGLGSGTLEAPLQAGTYMVNGVATAGDSCQETFWDYALTPFKTTLGTLTVLGECAPQSCGGQWQCGQMLDGCGGLLSCGACSEEKLCMDGTCQEVGQCDSPLLEVRGLEIGGEEPPLAVEAEKVLPLAVTWAAADSSQGSDGELHLVLGADFGPLFCRALESEAACPGSVTGSTGGFFTLPPYPGTHLLMAALVPASDCEEALEGFADAPRFPAAAITVEGGCAPASCESLGKECGDWGDGCGGILHCATCGEDSTCSSAGVCESPCADGIFEVTGISINGSGTTASCGPGKNAQVSLNWQLGNPDDCTDCPRQMVVGLGKQAGFCSEAGVPPPCPDHVDGNVSGYLEAPGDAGTYSVYALAAAEAGCTQAKETFENTPFKTVIGKLHVTDGCLPTSCLAMGKKCGLWDDGCGFTLNCGECPAGDLCNDSGSCYCSGLDPWEPNNSATTAFHLGTFTDKDVESKQEMQGAVQNEEDWFHMGATDVSWAYMEPYAQVEFGAVLPFEVLVVYRCADGTFPTLNELSAQGCKYQDSLPGVQLPGSSGAVSGYLCTGKGMPVDVQFGPACAILDDSGDFWVGVRSQQGCSSYLLTMHL